MSTAGAHVVTKGPVWEKDAGQPVLSTPPTTIIGKSFANIAGTPETAYRDWEILLASILDSYISSSTLPRNSQLQ